MYEIQHPHHKHHHSLEDRMQSRGFSYYVLAQVKGEKMLWGAYRTSEEAERIGMMRAPGNYEIVKLPTSNISEASRMMREQGITEDGLSPDSFRRFRH